MFRKCFMIQENDNDLLSIKTAKRTNWNMKCSWSFALCDGIIQAFYVFIFFWIVSIFFYTKKFTFLKMQKSGKNKHNYLSSLNPFQRMVWGAIWIMYVICFWRKIIVRNVHVCPIENVMEMIHFLSKRLYLKHPQKMSFSLQGTGMQKWEVKRHLE